MANATTWFTVSLTIMEGKVDAFEATVERMVAGSLREPGTLAYEFCLSADRTQCRLVEAYVDGDAVLAHLTGPVLTDRLCTFLLRRPFVWCTRTGTSRR